MKARSQLLILVMLGTIIFCEDTTGKSMTQQTICDRKCSDDVQCLKDCMEMSRNIKYGHREAGANVTLVCRDVTRIALAFNPGIFDVEDRISLDGNWSDPLRVNASALRISNLQPGTRRQFRFHRVFEDEVSKPEITGWFETMSNNYEPLRVGNISVLNFWYDVHNPMNVSSIISFIPAKDLSCSYEVELLILTEIYSGARNVLKNKKIVISQDRSPHEVRFWNPTGNRTEKVEAVEGKLLVTFSNLGIDATYSLTIKTETENGMKSEETILYFETPTCAFPYRINETICAPEKVEGLNATTTRKGENIFDVNVTWDMPKLIPHQYHIWINSRIENNQHAIHQKTSGTSTEFVFTDVEIAREFRVYITAESPHGPGPEIYKDFKIPEIITEATELDNFIRNYLTSTILGVIGIGIGIGIAVYGYFKLRKRRLSQVDEYEVSPKRLLTTRVLGKGAFGIVKLGSLRDDQGNLTTVAVKMLRDDSTANDLRSFLNEIKMMKALDEHPNIVSLLGCCTISPNPFLIVEYCSRGDLQSFLRKSVEARSPVVTAKKFTVICSQGLPQSNKIPEKDCDMSSMSSIDDDDVQISSCAEDRDVNCDPVTVTVLEMLNFGRQIATGMEFLSSNRIVHRDLATRNVLVCHNRTVKISDFGLSRDVYQRNIYKKSGNGRMPLKWMAIEALTHQLYSTHSDVWSFGILLWEIVTLGGNPYPGVPTLDLLKQLQSGYRMKRPENCSIPLYDMMMSCWRTRPQDRPTFTILRQELDKLISMNKENESSDLTEVSEGEPILP